ncbi:MAG TPA: C-terminal helicase domain-containing protein, partial [Acetobacteraceae bacterium]
GFAAVLLSGELSQHDRTQALQALRDGRASVCVATDVAARGLDLPDLALVVHADLPGSRDTLLHRSGRTGRAGRKGVSVVIVPHPKRRRAEQLFAAAGIAAQWGNPPTAAEIRARDAERMAEDPVLAREPDEAELAEARILLESRTPEQIAAALVRLYRARLPAVEESFAAEPEPRHPQPNRRDGAREGATVWFRMNVGRQKNADPKWILPAICRIGGISRADIGATRIFDKETKFEISRSAAPAFEAAVREADGTEFRIQPAGADRPARKDHSGPRPFKTPWLRDAKRAAPRP